jgi:hypothetical protein
MRPEGTDLIGSPAQISWALEIRRGMLARERFQVAYMMAQIDDAAWFIDHAGSGWNYTVEVQIENTCRQILPRLPPLIGEKRQRVKAAARRRELLRAIVANQWPTSPIHQITDAKWFTDRRSEKSGRGARHPPITRAAGTYFVRSAVGCTAMLTTS